MIGILSSGISIPDGFAQIFPPEWTYQHWLARTEALLKDESLVRFYTFEGVRETRFKVPNRAGLGGELSFGVAGGPGTPEEHCKIVEGRWPEMKAVRLDRGFLGAEPFEIANKSFTVEAWIRTHGLGSIHGDAVPAGGTLLSVGIGFWDGWRVTLLYPEKVMGLEIGRPAPVNAIGIRSGGFTDGDWHHLAATWDGQTMCLYLDGLLAASGPYSGDYYPPKPGGQFRLGFAGFGWGSTKMDVDEVAVYKRALTSRELLRSACLGAAIRDALAEHFEKAETALGQRDFHAAAAAYAEVLKAPDAHPCYLAAARLRMGEALRQLRKPVAAMAELQKVLETARAPNGLRARALAPFLQLARSAGGELPPSTFEILLKMDGLSAKDRMDVRLALARSYRQAGNFQAAQKEYEAILETSGLPPRERQNLLFQFGHASMQAKDYESAQAEYGKLVSLGDAPPHYRSCAQLRIAETYVRRRQWKAARVELEKLAAMSDAPESHRWEAQERLRELDRLKAGKSPMDPAWSRVQLPKARSPGKKLYVSPDGSDTNPGTKRRPFATLQQARDEIRSLKIQGRGKLPRAGVAVLIKPGEYRLHDTFKLTGEDSGTAEAPIIYRLDGSGEARLSGGVSLGGFRKVEDGEILARLPDEARGKVLQADLKAQGISDLGELRPRGFGRGPQPAMELFFNRQPMRLARWPNEGFVHTGKVIDGGAFDGLKGIDRGMAFEFNNDRLSRWQNAQDLWLYGYWYWHWADSAIGVASIDPLLRQIETRHGSPYGLHSDRPFFVFNLLEELDQPGEWYFDRGTGILYLYPPTDPYPGSDGVSPPKSESETLGLPGKTIQLSLLSGPLVLLEDAAHITLQGLSLELGRFDGVVIHSGECCLVAGCVLRQLGGTGVVIQGGRGHGVLSCDLHTLGRGGAWVRGGNRKMLTPGGHFIENCDIHDFSRIDRTYTPAVWMDGVGNRIAHNLFHHTPCHAMRIEGNDHVIEFNEVHHVVMESDDQGGVDMWFNPTYRGNVFRYNFWHDIGGQQTPCGQAGIRLDDAISGTLVYGNIFHRCSSVLFGGVQIHGGKENVIENNIFAECKYGISFSGWGEGRWKSFLASQGVVKATTQDVDIRQPPYSARYPSLARLPENPDVNFIWRNLVFDCGEFLTRDRGIQDLMENHLTSTNPGFEDISNGNFNLNPSSPIYDHFAFRPIPFEQMGLYEDDLRR